jgi:hypothetical protein
MSNKDEGHEEKLMQPVKVIVKTMTVTKSTNEVYSFFQNMKSLEMGGEISSLQESDDGWWTFNHASAGRSKMKHTNSVAECGILDHIFVGGGLTWNVFVRTIPNKDAPTTMGAFEKPDGLTDSQSEEQIKNFESEIDKWKLALENCS